jgi:hypothetical protein
MGHNPSMIAPEIWSPNKLYLKNAEEGRLEKDA